MNGAIRDKANVSIGTNWLYLVGFRPNASCRKPDAKSTSVTQLAFDLDCSVVYRNNFFYRALACPLAMRMSKKNMTEACNVCVMSRPYFIGNLAKFIISV